MSFLHLPVQAGSDRVLAAMKRGYTTLEFVRGAPPARRPAEPDAVVRLHRRLPGETEEDFEKTMKLIEDVGFDTSFSFVYCAVPARRRPT